MPLPRLLSAAACAVALVATPLVVAPAVAAPAKVSAHGLLAHLPVRTESHAGSYDRDRFDLWLDADHDGLDTRAEVLTAESSRKATVSAAGTVKTGRWRSPYDGKVFTVGSKLDVDHVVPLAEAWASGAWRWTAARRAAYANDLGYAGSLIAVSKHANRSKGDDDPAEYLPPAASFRCAYVRDWVAVKSRWHLSVDRAERHAILRVMHRSCSSTRVAKPGRPDVAALTGGTTTHSPSTPSKPTSAGGTYYKNCDAARAAGVTPLHKGDPGYDPHLDRDGDGTACE